MKGKNINEREQHNFLDCLNFWFLSAWTLFFVSSVCFRSHIMSNLTEIHGKYNSRFHQGHETFLNFLLLKSWIILIKINFWKFFHSLEFIFSHRIFLLSKMLWKWIMIQFFWTYTAETLRQFKIKTLRNYRLNFTFPPPVAFKSFNAKCRNRVAFLLLSMAGIFFSLSLLPCNCLINFFAFPFSAKFILSQ